MLLGKTCHKKRIGETSDVSHLQTFGCKGFVLYNPGKDKFQAKAKEAMFVGHSNFTKG